MKFAKQMFNLPPHLTYVAALPWEIKSLNLLQIRKNENKMNFFTYIHLM